MKIAVDFDNTLVDTGEVMIDIYNNRYNKNITKEDIDKWNYWGEKIFGDIYPRACKRMHQYRLLDDLAPYYLFLFNIKYHIDILTLSYSSKREMKRSLKRLNIRKGLEYNDLIKANKKKLEYDYDIYIDDNPTMIEGIQDYEHKYLLLYDSPWNKGFDCEPYRNVFRVSNWHEICEKVEMIEKVCK